MAANTKVLIEVEPDVMQKAQLDASAHGQSVEEVLSAWVKRGAAVDDEAWDIPSPIEASEAAAMLMQMLENHRGRDVPK